MMSPIDRFRLALERVPIEDAQAALDAKRLADAGRDDALIESMVSSGWVEVEEQQGHLTADGRPVVSMLGRFWVLPPEEFARRRDVMLAQAEQRERLRREQAAHVEQPTETERIAATTCPQMVGGKPCGGALNHKPVCGACVTGRLGFRHRYSCESCGLDIVTREELRA